MMESVSSLCAMFVEDRDVSRSFAPIILRTALALVAAGLFVIGLVLPSAMPAQASSGVSPTINFQGRLLTAAGAVVADGNYNVEFKIYQEGDGKLAGDAIDGAIPAGTLLWTEDWLNSNSTTNPVVVKNGYFSVNLGTYCPLTGTSCTGGQTQGSNTAVNFNDTTLWLSMNVAGATQATGSCAEPFATNCAPDGEMLPMNQMGSAPYAQNAANSDQVNSYGANNNLLDLASPVLGAPSLVAGGSLTVSTQYFYEVTAVNSSGETLASASANDTTSAGNLSIKIPWTVVPGATSYKIYRNTSNTFTSGSLYLTTVTNGSLSSYIDTGSATSAGLPPTTVTGSAVTLQGWSGQTANLLQLETSTGSNVFKIDASGNVTDTATEALQGANALTLGSSANLGVARFLDGTADGFFANLQLAGTIASTQTYSLPTTGGTICDTGVICTAPGSQGNYLVQDPTATGTDTITPTGGTTGLTVNGSTTATVALVVAQAQAADGEDINVTNTAATALNIAANTNTSGNVLNVGASSASQVSDTLLNISQSGVSTTYTGNVVNIQGTATTGGGNLVNLSSGNTTAGSALTVAANSVTSGKIVSISGTAVAGGSALLVTGPSGAQSVSSGIVQITASGAFVGTGGLLNVNASGTTTGTLESIGASNTSQTSDTLLNIAQSGVSTGYTGNVVNIQGTSTTGGGILVNLSSANTTTGSALAVAANSASSGNVVTISATSISSGSALLVTGPSGATAVSNGVLQVTASGAYTGTGGLLNVNASGTTAGTLASIGASNISQTSDTLLNIAQSGVSTGYTGNVVNIQGTSTTGGGNLVNLSSANTTSGAALVVAANSASSGNVLTVSATSIAGGSALLVTGPSSATALTNGVVQVTASGAYTGIGGLLNLTANSTLSGNVASISGTSLTTGSALAINAGAGKAITVSGGTTLLETSTNSVTAFQVQNASGFSVLTVDTSSNGAQGQAILGVSSHNNGTLAFDNSAGATQITLGTTASNTNTYSLDLPLAAPTGASQCLTTSSATQLLFASCTTGDIIQAPTTSATNTVTAVGTGTSALTLQNAASSTVPVLVIKGGATPATGGDLEQLQDSTGSNVLRVDAAGNEESLGYFDNGIGGIGQYANLLTYSEQLNQAAWVDTNVVPTANNAVAPDGNSTATKLVGTGSSNVIQTYTTAVAGTYTFSVWLKQSSGGANTGLCIFEAGTGAPTTCTATAVTPNATDWQRFSVTQAVTATVTSVKVEILPGNTATATIWAWGAQLVLGSTPEVYSRTTTSVDPASSGVVSNGGAFISADSNSDVPLIVQGATAQSGDLLELQNASAASLFKVSSAGAITAPTTTNTINNLVINAGALSNVGTTITAAGALTVSTTGANALKLDTGSGAAIDIGPTNATSIVLGGNSTATITDEVANSSTTAYTLQTQAGASLLVADSTDNDLFVGGNTASSAPPLFVLGQFNGTSGSGYPAVVDGAMFFDSGEQAFECGENSTWEACAGGLVDDITSNTNLYFATNQGSINGTDYTMPANDCQPGVVFQMYGAGEYVGGGSQPTIYFGLWQNGGPIAGGWSTAPAGGTNNFQFNMTMTCRSTTTAIATGTYTMGSSITNIGNPYPTGGPMMTAASISASSVPLGIGITFSGSVGPGAGAGFELSQFVMNRVGPP